jgi:O-antigen/teichoic acid export membrane protein
MSSADVPYVQSVFSGQTPLYMAASMIGLAMITFTTPLAAVMFPKVVRSTALTQDTRALQHALSATVLLVGAAALACTLLPTLPLRIVYFSKPEYWAAAPLVPWFAWCLLPLILANVLASNLLARAHYRVVPWMVAVASAYGLTLYGIRARLLAMEPMDAFRTVVQTLGAFSLLLLAVTLWFSWKQRTSPAAAEP